MSATLAVSRARAGRLLKRARTGRLRHLIESLWTSVGIQAFLFGSGIIVARSLGPSGRGDIAIVLILPAVAAQVVCAGVPSATTYFVARYRASWQSVAGHVPRVATLQACAAVALVLLLDALFLADRGDATHVAALLAVATVPLLIAQYYALAILSGLEDLRWWNIFRAAPAACYTVGLISGLAFGLTIVACASIWLAGQVVATSALLRHLRHRHRAGPAGADRDGLPPSRRELVRFGVVGFLAQVSPVETFYIDTLVVAALFPAHVVGYYAVAFSVSNAPRFVADGIVAVGYPHVSAQDPKEGRSAMKRYILVAVVLCGATAAAIVLLLPWLIPLLFGNAYRPAIGIGSILVAAVGVISVRRVGSDCLRALGRPGVATSIEVVVLSVLALGILALGHWREGRGVALSVAMSAAVGLGLTLLFLRRMEAREG